MATITFNEIGDIRVSRKRIMRSASSVSLNNKTGHITSKGKLSSTLDALKNSLKRNRGAGLKPSNFDPLSSSNLKSLDASNLGNKSNIHSANNTNTDSQNITSKSSNITSTGIKDKSQKGLDVNQSKGIISNSSQISENFNRISDNAEDISKLKSQFKSVNSAIKSPKIKPYNTSTEDGFKTLARSFDTSTKSSTEQTVGVINKSKNDILDAIKELGIALVTGYYKGKRIGLGGNNGPGGGPGFSLGDLFKDWLGWKALKSFWKHLFHGKDSRLPKDKFKEKKAPKDKSLKDKIKEKSPKDKSFKDKIKTKFNEKTKSVKSAFEKKFPKTTKVLKTAKDIAHDIRHPIDTAKSALEKRLPKAAHPIKTLEHYTKEHFPKTSKFLEDVKTVAHDIRHPIDTAKDFFKKETAKLGKPIQDKAVTPKTKSLPSKTLSEALKDTAKAPKPIPGAKPKVEETKLPPKQAKISDNIDVKSNAEKLPKPAKSAEIPAKSLETPKQVKIADAISKPSVEKTPKPEKVKQPVKDIVEKPAKIADVAQEKPVVEPSKPLKIKDTSSEVNVKEVTKPVKVTDIQPKLAEKPIETKQPRLPEEAKLSATSPEAKVTPKATPKANINDAISKDLGKLSPTKPLPVEAKATPKSNISLKDTIKHDASVATKVASKASKSEGWLSKIGGGLKGLGAKALGVLGLGLSAKEIYDAWQTHDPKKIGEAISDVVGSYAGGFAGGAAGALAGGVGAIGGSIGGSYLGGMGATKAFDYIYDFLCGDSPEDKKAKAQAKQAFESKNAQQDKKANQAQKVQIDNQNKQTQINQKAQVDAGKSLNKLAADSKAAIDAIPVTKSAADATPIPANTPLALFSTPDLPKLGKPIKDKSDNSKVKNTASSSAIPKLSSKDSKDLSASVNDILSGSSMVMTANKINDMTDGVLSDKDRKDVVKTTSIVKSSAISGQPQIVKKSDEIKAKMMAMGVDPASTAIVVNQPDVKVQEKGFFSSMWSKLKDLFSDNAEGPEGGFADPISMGNDPTSFSPSGGGPGGGPGGGYNPSGGSGGAGGGSFGSGIDPSNLGALSSYFETGNNSADISWDSGGGTTYGKYQISTKNGTMNDFVKYLKKQNDPEAQKLADFILKNGINVDTGSKHGAGPDAWKAMAKNDPNMMNVADKYEFSFLKDKSYDPVYAKLNPEARKLVDSSPGLQQILFGTANQFGPGNALPIFNESFRPNMNVGDYIRSIEADKTRRFPSTANRFNEEISFAEQTDNAQGVQQALNNMSDASKAMNSALVMGNDDAIARHVGYSHAYLDSHKGAVDCSAWWLENNRNMMMEMNRISRQKTGQDLFPPDKMKELLSNRHSTTIVEDLAKLTGERYSGSDILSHLVPGATIGMTGIGDHAGNDHICQVVEENGQLYVIESSGNFTPNSTGRTLPPGVKKIPLEDWKHYYVNGKGWGNYRFVLSNIQSLANKDVLAKMNQANSETPTQQAAIQDTNQDTNAPSPAFQAKVDNFAKNAGNIQEAVNNEAGGQQILQKTQQLAQNAQPLKSSAINTNQQTTTTKPVKVVDTNAQNTNQANPKAQVVDVTSQQAPDVNAPSPLNPPAPQLTQTAQANQDQSQVKVPPKRSANNGAQAKGPVPKPNVIVLNNKNEGKKRDAWQPPMHINDVSTQSHRRGVGNDKTLHGSFTA